MWTPIALVLGIALVAVLACGSDTADTGRSLEQPFPDPIATTIATPAPIAATAKIDAACIDAMITAITGHIHQVRDPQQFSITHEPIWENPAMRRRYPNYAVTGSLASERELTALLEPCDSFR